MSRIPHPAPRRRRAPILVSLVLSLATVGFTSGCGGADSKVPDYPERAVKLPDLTKSGTVTGVVRFAGTPPKRLRLAMPDAACTEHEGALSEDVVVTDGKLRDVLVWVKSGLEAFTFDYEKTEAVIDQQGCMYVPHVLAVRTFQPVAFHSSDRTQHNINTTRSKSGQGFNRTLSGAGERFLWQFKKPEIGLESICNIHPWMKAYIHVVDHPYFAVTKDDGAFSLPKLPPGTYVLEAWHGELGKREATVTIKDGETSTQDFEFTKR